MNGLCLASSGNLSIANEGKPGEAQFYKLFCVSAYFPYFEEINVGL
jgi:hypothetical protein